MTENFPIYLGIGICHALLYAMRYMWVILPRLSITKAAHNMSYIFYAIPRNFKNDCPQKNVVKQNTDSECFLCQISGYLTKYNKSAK